MQNVHQHYKRNHQIVDQNVYKEQLGSVGNILIMSVDGEYIRDNIDVDFLMGGNPGPYKYVPNNEVWIEYNLSAIDTMSILLHELIEMYHMKSGHMTYNRAHKLADQFEEQLRNVYANSDISKSEGIEIVEKFVEAEGLISK